MDYSGRGSSTEQSTAVDVDADLDYPNSGAPHPVFVRAPIPHIAAGIGVAQADVLDLYPGRQALMTQQQAGTSAREMSLEYIFSRKSFLYTITWDVAQGDGFVQAVGDLTPPVKMVRLVPSGQELVPTLLGYASLPFSFWRGSLRLTLMVVSSKFHTGRLAVCAHYGRTSAEATTTDEAMAQYAHVIDLTESNTTHVIDFPYKSPLEMLEVPFPDSMISDSTYDDTRYSMGQFSIRVLNSLQAPDTVSQTVSIVVFWSAGPGFSVDFPRQMDPRLEIKNPYEAP